MLRQLPSSAHPNLLVGFETRDDAGVFRLSDDQALVQTVDFFTPIVDDPYAYGAIAAANSLSDIYAMGGIPLTAMNIACFNPAIGSPEEWAAVLRGMHDKTVEAGAAVIGGHSVEDDEPKFGLSVTGIVDPNRMFTNANAKPGDLIHLSKPLGTGIVTTAAKYDQCPASLLSTAIESMSSLNQEPRDVGLAAGVTCATDITGFGLAGHLFNIANASNVEIEIDWEALPVFDGVEQLVKAEMTTGGAAKNRAFLADSLHFSESVPEWIRQVILDPQTSGGLALFSPTAIAGYALIGRARHGSPAIRVN